jgi:hypothetical protein
MPTEVGTTLESNGRLRHQQKKKAEEPVLDPFDLLSLTQLGRSTVGESTSVT